MERQNEIYSFDFAYIYGSVPEAGTLILDRLSLLDLNHLSLVNKQLRDVVRHYGKHKNDLSIGLVSNQHPKVTRVSLGNACLEYNSAQMNGTYFSVWYDKKYYYYGCPDFEETLPTVHGHPLLIHGVIYDLAEKNHPQYEVNVLKNHILDLELNVKSCHNWYNYVLVKSFFSQEKKVAVWLKAWFTSTSEMEVYMVLLYDLTDGTLLAKNCFHLINGLSTFGFSSSMAVTIDKLDIKEDSSDEEMEVEVNVYYSKENFSNRRTLCQSTCAKAIPWACVVTDNVIMFCVKVKETKEFEWYRLQLSPDLTSVISKSILSHYHDCIDWLDSGHAIKDCKLKNEKSLLYFYHKRGRRTVCLATSLSSMSTSTNSEGDFALSYFYNAFDWKKRQTVIILFDQTGKVMWKKNMKKYQSFSPSSITLYGKTILLICSENFLHVFNTKTNSAIKHQLWSGGEKGNKKVFVVQNQVIALALDSFKTFKRNNSVLTLKCWNLD